MNAALYDVARAGFRLVFGTVWRMQVRGANNVPASGGVIVACNHLSYFDPPLLGTGCPRRLRYMAKGELFALPLLGPAIRAVGAYPVDRRASALSAVKRSVDVLRAGDAVGIFPEGTRNLHGEAHVHGGVALLASLSGAPVVPACIRGTDRARRLARFEVVFGPPLRLPAERKATRQELANFTDEIMQTIRRMAARGN